MGLLTAGAPLTWSETKKHARYIQEQGIKQFIYLYNKFSARVKRKLKFGDEIEYTLVRFDPHSGHAQLLLAASDLLEKLPHYEENGEPIIWQPEYAEYMIEGLPGCPFGQLLHSFTSIERSMRKRRLQLESHLPKGCCALTISVFPRLGCPDFTYPPCAPTPHEGPSRSLFFPTEAINQGHPRFM
ncbi:putative Glutamate--cysteine ligase catalytic subunit [Fasciola hepatica]|uniref:Glutamate--cysteine ligase n=1 Tax=Fasciola hepatica TaxID=6192 RepID=A0A2H1BV60_FASHE|nr:putative Glutamate--cysteine ligase catalytic subunit [Fasciola hepatica]